MSFEAMRSSVQRKWARIHEHRPRTLMIALNGQVIANHDVRSEHNRLSARIERTEKAQFVEVFSEQNVRLALIEVSEPPPDGPPLSLQRIALSDARWLELSLTYDGLGLQSEVTYFDPALSAVVIEEDEEARCPSSRRKRKSRRMHSACCKLCERRWQELLNFCARWFQPPQWPGRWWLRLP